MFKFLFSIFFIHLMACNNLAENASNKLQTKNDSIPYTDTNKKSSSPQLPITNNNVADNILDSISKLSFVVKSNSYIDSFSNHKHGIAFMVDSTEKIWLIKAGYNGKERFESYFQFYVNPATKDIKVYDIINDEQLSIEEYLKNK